MPSEEIHPAATGAGHHGPEPLVGRDDELRRLLAAVGSGDVARTTAARHAVLAGDAGIGKSRLLGALADRVAGSGKTLVTGHCLDFGAASLPYLPFTEIFGQLQAAAPAEIAAIAHRHRAIRLLLPAQRVQPEDAGFESGGDDDHLPRTELFDAVARALEQVAGDRGLVVIIEDLHWSDPSSRDLITYLLARRFRHPVSLVLSYRSDDLVRSHPLRALLANWSRLDQLDRIDLPALPAAALRTVASRHRPDLDAAALAAVVDRADGNAFYAEELAAAADGPEALPADLAGLLLLRLDRLTESARHVVRVASVAGRQIGHTLLSAVAELDESELDRAIRDAVESQVLVGHTDGYSFRHALVGEAVYDDLLPGERVRCHARFVTALQRPGVDQTAAELARHARAAHDLATAFRASVDAGDEASRVGGAAEALDHYRFALELADAGDRGSSAGLPSDPAERLPVITQLTIKASDAAESAGRLDLAIELLRDLLADAGGLTGSLRATVLQALAATLLYSDYDLDERALISEALELIDPDRDQVVYARLMATRARSDLNLGRYEDALEAAKRATEIGQRLSLHRIVADQSILRARIKQRLGDPETSVREIERVLATAASEQDVTTQLRGHDQLGSIRFEQGRMAEAIEAFRRGADHAVRTGRPWSPYGLDAVVMAAQAAFILGDWDECLALAAGSDDAPAIARANLDLGVLAVGAGRGDPDALQLLPGLRRWWPYDSMIIINCTPAIDLYASTGELAAATALHDDIAEALRSVYGPHFIGRVRLSGSWLGVVADALAEPVGPGAGGSDLLPGADRAMVLARETMATVQQSRSLGPEAYAWMARAQAEHLLVRHRGGGDVERAELITAWQAAVDGFARYGHAFELARSRARLAAVLLDGDDQQRAAAAPMITEAAETARRLGARPLLSRLQRLAPGSAGTADAAPEQQNPLTSREREVLALVADGLSNRAIGEQLVISVKTASVHVSHIIAKLGAQSRTGAAALARRRGLLD